MLLVAVLAAPGCYYAHLAQGQARVLLGRVDIEDVLAHPDTPAPLAYRLGVVVEARAFARKIGLKVEGQYTSYLAWPGDRVITTLVVSPPGSVSALPFDFPLLGSVPYKGYFDLSMAESAGDAFRNAGMDVCLAPVAAYSTLGFFDDPVTDPMLAGGDGSLVETIIHELVHSTIFLESRPDFNEGVARFIGQEASVRFYPVDSAARDRRRREVRDGRDLAGFLLAFRSEVSRIYAQAGAREAVLRARSESEKRARSRLASLPLGTYDTEKLARKLPLNDACLALGNTYSEELPRLQAVLDRVDGDLTRFIARLRAAGETRDPVAAFFSPARGTPLP